LRLSARRLSEDSAGDATPHDTGGVFTLYGTQKLRDRVPMVRPSRTVPTTTVLGDWYATDLRWRPQVALLVNEATLLPVLLPLAPAASLLARVPTAVAEVLRAHGVAEIIVEREVDEMATCRVIQTANRSVVGVMREFAFLAAAHRDHQSTVDLLDLSVRLARTPCSPLYKTYTSPDRALAAFVADADDGPIKRIRSAGAGGVAQPPPPTLG
jgi:hypothetical protein